MSNEKVISVFGSKLTSNGKFPEFVYRQLDRAAEIARREDILYLFLCGSHPMKCGLRGLPKECDVAEAYVRDHHPQLIQRVIKEERSTNLPENLLYLRMLLEHGLGFRRPKLLLFTIKPLVRRIQYLYNRIFGTYGTVELRALPTSVRFPREELVLGDTMHMLENMRPGDYRFLLGPKGESRWLKLREEHEKCPYRQAGALHPYK